MNGHELLEKLELVNDRYIMEAEEAPRKHLSSRRAVGLAAVLCLVAALAALLPRLGGNSSPTSGDKSGYTGHDGPTEFMRYEGPILPLTVWEETPLTAERKLTMDFGAYGTDRRRLLDISDRYILTNPTEEDITATVSYPVIGSFREMSGVDITVDGVTADTTLSAGVYAGGFRGAGDTNTTSLNLDYPHSWEGYRDLLSDGSYMAGTSTDVPALDDIVTVYEITDIKHDAPESATNPTLNFTFTLPRETICLSYGFNGGRYDPDGGLNQRHFSIPKEGWPDWGHPRYLIFLGPDIDDYTMQGYADGGCDAGEEIGATAAVNRYETPLGEILDECASLFFDSADTGYISPTVSEEICREQVRRHFARYGVAGSDAKERYDGGMLEDIISETAIHQRVMYHTFPVTVPAGGSVTVEATTTKLPSFDFDCVGSPNTGIDGYDLMTCLGSPLTFTGQSAAIENYDFIDIVRQNFGFDTASGVTEVSLDMAWEHYYIEVREIIPIP